MRRAAAIIAWLEDAGLAGVADDAAGDDFSLEDVCRSSARGDDILAARLDVWRALVDAGLTTAALAKGWGVPIATIEAATSLNDIGDAQLSLAIAAGPGGEAAAPVWRRHANRLLPFIAGAGAAGRDWPALMAWGREHSYSIAGRTRHYTHDLLTNVVSWMYDDGMVRESGGRWCVRRAGEDGAAAAE